MGDQLAIELVQLCVIEVRMAGGHRSVIPQDGISRRSRGIVHSFRSSIDTVDKKSGYRDCVDRNTEVEWIRRIELKHGCEDAGEAEVFPSEAFYSPPVLHWILG